MGRALAEEVAWGGFEDEPFVPPVIYRPDIPLEEVAEDFWRKIGYSMPESRSWQRSGKAEGGLMVCLCAGHVLCRR
jgi:hypothetical protein